MLELPSLEVCRERLHMAIIATARGWLGHRLDSTIAKVFPNPTDPAIDTLNRARKNLRVNPRLHGPRIPTPLGRVRGVVGGCALGHAPCSGPALLQPGTAGAPARLSRISRGPRRAGGAAHAPGGRAARGGEAGPGRPCGERAVAAPSTNSGGEAAPSASAPRPHTHTL